MKKYLVLITLFSLLMSIGSGIAAAPKAGEVREVSAKNPEKCVEYYIINGKNYCSSKALAPAPNLQGAAAHERVKVRFDDRVWRLAWWNQDPRQPTFEYTVGNEKVQNWTELVTTQYFPGLQQKLSPAKLMNMTLANMQQRGFRPTFKILALTSTDVLFEWQINDPKHHEHELQRIIQTGTGLYVLHYAAKPTITPPRRQAWVQLLQKATVR